MTKLSKKRKFFSDSVNDVTKLQHASTLTSRLASCTEQWFNADINTVNYFFANIDKCRAMLEYSFLGYLVNTNQRAS